MTQHLSTSKFCPALYLDFMEALTAPRVDRKAEAAAQMKMRGLGIEESDNKTSSEAPLHHHEVAKPRGIEIFHIFHEN